MWLFMLLAFALTVLTRLPFTSSILYHWDSVNVALGMREFDVARQQPQPPGYILYVALARLFDAVLADPQTTLVLISILFSGLAAAAIFALGRELLPRYGDWAGLIAALLLISSPLIWFYGEIALPHTVDLFFVTLLGLLAWRIRSGAHELLPWLAVLLALTGGVRQQTLAFMLPLLVWCLWRVPIKRLVLSGLLCGALVLIWLVPLLMSAGGLASYLTLTSSYSQIFFDPTSVFGRGGFEGLWRNSAKLLLYTLYGVGFALVPLLAWVVWRSIGSPGARQTHRTGPTISLPPKINTAEPDVNVRSSSGGSADLALRPAKAAFSVPEQLLARSRVLADPAPTVALAADSSARRLLGGPEANLAIFFALWIAPPALFYALIHMGQPGLVLTYLPAVLVAAAAALLQLATRLKLDWRHALLACGVLAALNSLVFLLAPEYPLGMGYSRVLSRNTIVNHDRWFQSRIAEIKRQNNAANSFILARDPRIFSYYLPDYKIARAPAPPENTDPLLEPADFSIHSLDRAAAGLAGEGAWWVLLPDMHWHQISAEKMETSDLPGGRLTALYVPAGGRVEYNGVMIRVVGPTVTP